MFAMPLNMDLVRELLSRFEKGDDSVPEGRTKQEVAYHVKQMIDGGLLDGQVTMAPSPGKLLPRDYFVKDITWKGHEFIRSVREDTVWHHLKAHFNSKGVALTVDLILEFLKSQARANLGF